MAGFLIKLLCASLVGLSCTVFLKGPRDTWKQTAFSALMGWVLMYLLNEHLGISSPLATYISSLNVAIMAQYMARRYKKPASIFFVPGFFTMVPGSLIYRTVMAFFNGDRALAYDFLSDTILTGLAIVLAIFTVDTVLYKTMLYREDREKNKKI